MLGDAAQVTGVRFGSRARKAGFEQGFEVVAVQVPTDRPTPHWFYLPALLMRITKTGRGRFHFDVKRPIKLVEVK